MELLSLKKLKDTRLADLILPTINRFIWTAILDNKVCDLCRSLDQKVMEANSQAYSLYQPPLHPRCRCHIIPITSDADIIPKADWEKPKDILSIEEYIRETELRNIENAKQKMSIMEKESMRIFYIVFFLNKLGQIILEKESEQDIEIDFTNREEAQIKKE